MSAIEVSRSPSQAWSWRARGRPSAQVIVYSVLLLFVANIVLVPLGMVIATSLNVGPITAPGTVGLTFMNYVQAWTSPTTHAVIMNTLIFATVSTMMSMIVGVFFAFMVERTDMPLKNFAYAVVP
ncbi:MAG TPA: hypothetical protein VHX16_14385, partial [Chloroflexota bacterium]|nr:hypothetical protein [Chloroflexota bacterium]